MELHAVALELYGLAPAEFTASRDARVAEAKKAGERELAKAIAKLRRPSTSAWLANMLVRDGEDRVTDMLQLGVALRQAQDRSDKEELRKLQSRRRRAMAALVERAANLAQDRGESISDAVGRELQATLEAALLDPEAAAALLGGCLTTGLHYAGLGWPVATDGPLEVSGVPGPGPVEGPLDEARVGPTDIDAERRAAADGARRQAAADLADAEREADDRRRELEGLARALDRCRRETAELEQRLGQSRADQQEAERKVADAEEALSRASQRWRAAQLRLREAEACLKS
jgi:hypothetical protein